MNKEFIPYEQALALKELGFDEFCFGYFRDGKLSGVNKWDRKDWEFHVISNKDITNITHEIVLAPTYSQAFRFFKEKYKLYHDIKMFGDWDKPQYSYYVSGRIMNNPARMWHYEDVNSYPEAELACLKKLIEIVKNK